MSNLFIVFTIISSCFITALLFLGFFWWFVDRPTRHLIQILELAPTKDFLVRAPEWKGIVIGKLAKSFNQLLEQITKLDAFKLESERQLIAAEQRLRHQEELQRKNQVIESTNRELEARLKELSILHDFSQKTASIAALEELYLLLEQYLADKLGFQEFTFLIFEEASQSVCVKAARGFLDNQRVKGMCFKAGEGVTGRVLETAQPIYIPDTRLEPGYRHYKGEKEEDGSFFSIPLIFQNKIVGVLNMFRNGVDRFSTQERQFLVTLGAEVSIALMLAKAFLKTP